MVSLALHVYLLLWIEFTFPLQWTVVPWRRVRVATVADRDVTNLRGPCFHYNFFLGRTIVFHLRNGRHISSYGSQWDAQNHFRHLQINLALITLTFFLPGIVSSKSTRAASIHYHERDQNVTRQTLTISFKAGIFCNTWKPIKSSRWCYYHSMHLFVYRLRLIGP